MPRRGLVDAIWQAWRAPRGAMAAELARGPSEARALVQLMLACGLCFVASVPNAVREAQGLGVEDPVAAAVTAHLFGWIALAPLAAYGLAALLHLGALAFGARGRGFLAARAALFWSALVGAPLALGLAVAGVLAEAAGQGGAVWLEALGLAGLGAWLWILAASLAEAYGFAATGPVAAVLAASVAGALVVATLAIGGGPAGQG